MPPASYDLIVIGAGPVGENVASSAHDAGLSVAIVESDLVGGECSYWACIPSKTLLRPPAALRGALDVAGAKEAATGHLDVDAVFARRDRMVGDWNDAGQAKWLSGAGIELFRGKGRLAGERKVTVTHADDSRTELTARHAVAVCTGTVASKPESIAGLAEADVWTSREATSAKEAPGHLVVVGGGVVACEMATAFAAFGSRITMLVRDWSLLPGEEEFVGEMVADSLTAKGADIRYATEVRGIDRLEDGTVEVSADGIKVAGDEVLLAVGRTPATADLGLDTVGLKKDSAGPHGANAHSSGAPWIEVDDTLLVRGVPGDWLYAVGDVNHRVMLTHMGKYQARAAGDAIAARAKGRLGSKAPQRWSPYRADADVAAVPQVIFTDPEVAAVGLTEQAARDQGLSVTAVRYDLASIAGAATHSDDYTGAANLVVDDERQVVVGATFVGPEVGEMIHAATIAVVGEVPISRLWHAVPAFPTVSEVWLRLLEALGRETAHQRV